MTTDLPDYSALDPPDEKAPEDFSTHERRAAVLQIVINSGTPAQVNQRRLADYFDVHPSTISRDMDRLRESIDSHLGNDATLTTRALFEKTVTELQEDGEWKKAWNVCMEWAEFLENRGALDREPARSELDVDMRSRHSEVAYEIVRETNDVELPSADDADGEIDYEAAGFLDGPAGVDVEAVDAIDDTDDGGGS